MTDIYDLTEQVENVAFLLSKMLGSTCAQGSWR